MTCSGAENETRTRDPNLGKVMLYQLSYFRISLRDFWFLGLRLGIANKFPLLSTCTQTPHIPQMGLQRYTLFLNFQIFMQLFSKKSIVVRDSARFPNGPNIIIQLPLPNLPASIRCRSFVPGGCSRVRTSLLSIFLAFL